MYVFVLRLQKNKIVLMSSRMLVMVFALMRKTSLVRMVMKMNWEILHLNLWIQIQFVETGRQKKTNYFEMVNLLLIRWLIFCALYLHFGSCISEWCQVLEEDFRSHFRQICYSMYAAVEWMSQTWTRERILDCWGSLICSPSMLTNLLTYKCTCIQ